MIKLNFVMDATSFFGDPTVVPENWQNAYASTEGLGVNNGVNAIKMNVLSSFKGIQVLLGTANDTIVHNVTVYLWNESYVLPWRLYKRTD